MFLKWNDDALKKKKKTKSSVTTRLEKQENSIHKNESGGFTNPYTHIASEARKRTIFSKYHAEKGKELEKESGVLDIEDLGSQTNAEWGWEEKEARGRDPRCPPAGNHQAHILKNIIKRPRHKVDIPSYQPGGDFVFFQYSANYTSTDAMGLCINLFGITPLGETCLVRIVNYLPYIVVRDTYSGNLENTRRFLEGLEQALQKTCKYRWFTKNLKRLVVGHETPKGEVFWEYTGEGEVRFIKIYLGHPELVRQAETLLRNPLGGEFCYKTAKGGEKKVTLDPWLPTHLVPNGQFEIFDAHVDYLVSFFSHKQLVPASWMTVAKGKWDVVPRGTRTAASRCDIEIHVDCQDLSMCALPSVDVVVPAFRVLSWDIETLPRNGHFPDAKTCPVLVVAFHVADKGVPGHPQHGYAFVLGWVPPFRDDLTVFCYDFNDEAAMLEDIRYFRQAIDHQVEIGYNTNHFDQQYMEKRAKALSLPDFAKYSYMHRESARTNTQKSRTGQIRSTVSVPGIFTYDMLNHMYYYEKFEDNTLGAVSARMLGGETKEEFTYDQIAGAMTSTRGRITMTEYCYTDAVLPYKMFDKKGCLFSSIQSARVFTVNMQNIVDEGSEFKVTGRILQYLKNSSLSGRPIGFIPSFRRKNKVDSAKANKKYKGATVLDPIQGYYGRGGVKCNMRDEGLMGSFMRQAEEWNSEEEEEEGEGGEGEGGEGEEENISEENSSEESSSEESSSEENGNGIEEFVNVNDDEDDENDLIENYEKNSNSDVVEEEEEEKEEKEEEEKEEKEEEEKEEKEEKEKEKEKEKLGDKGLRRAQSNNGDSMEIFQKSIEKSGKKRKPPAAAAAATTESEVGARYKKRRSHSPKRKRKKRKEIPAVSENPAAEARGGPMSYAERCIFRERLVAYIEAWDLPPSRKEKLLKKIRSIPVPRDWAEDERQIADETLEEMAERRRELASWMELLSAVWNALRLDNYAGVITLDFEGLYPSIIMAHNLCLSTIVSKKTIEALGLRRDIDYWVYEELYHIEPDGTPKMKPNDNPPCFLKPSVLKGIMGMIQEDLKKARDQIKKKMAALKNQMEDLKTNIRRKAKLEHPALEQENEKAWLALLDSLYLQCEELEELQRQYFFYDCLQNAFKTWMNSMYGLLGMSNGKFSRVVIATVVTGTGRNMIQISKWKAETRYAYPLYPFFVRVIYGDTDSIFAALFGLTPRKDVLKAIGAIMAKEITKCFDKPKNLQFEKVYLNMIIGENKKMYAGRKVVVGVPEDKLEIKGYPFTKRGACKFEKTVMGTALQMLIMDGDAEGAEAHVKGMLHQLVTGDIPIYDLITNMSLGKMIEKYPNMRPSLEIAIKYNDPGNPRKEGDRIEWVFVKAPPKAKEKSDMAEDPEVAVARRLPINYQIYIDRVHTQIVMTFGPVYGGDKSRVRRVFETGPHMRYSVDPYSQSGERNIVPENTRNPFYSITKYLAAGMERCRVCKKLLETREFPPIHPECKLPRCRICGVLVGPAETRVPRSAPNSSALAVATKQKAPVRPQGRISPSLAGRIGGNEHIFCSDCAPSEEKVIAVLARKPWEDRERPKCASEVRGEIAKKLTTWTQVRDECVQKCVACVGAGNESRIDQCISKSCKWWRKGNYASDMREKLEMALGDLSL